MTALSGGVRTWWHVTAQLPATTTGTLLVRWQYVTDPEYTGRGVNVAGVRISDSSGVLLNGDGDPKRVHRSQLGAELALSIG